MRNYRPRRNKYRHDNRSFRRNGSEELGNNPSIFLNDQRKFFNRNNNHNASKLLEKYNNLAREALSSGDKILSENYYQHADHFLRLVENQNLAANNLKNNLNNVSSNKNSNDQTTLKNKNNTSSKTSSNSEKI